MEMTEKSNEAENAREALMKTLDAVKCLSRTYKDDLPKDVCAILGRVAFEANAALSAPRRNCDVGTEDEQAKRFMHYCENRVCNRRDCPYGYEELFRHKCAIRWAQMLYKRS